MMTFWPQLPVQSSLTKWNFFPYTMSDIDEASPDNSFFRAFMTMILSIDSWSIFYLGIISLILGLLYGILKYHCCDDSMSLSADKTVQHEHWQSRDHPLQRSVYTTVCHEQYFFFFLTYSLFLSNRLDDIGGSQSIEFHFF